MATIISAAVCFLAAVALVVEMPAVRKKFHLGDRRRTQLERLADVMEGAYEKNRLRATAAVEALRAEEEREARTQ